MNQELFQTALNKIMNMVREENGIGTLKEKTIHAVLKHYYEPNQTYHEQRVAGFVADIYNGSQIIEIQSRNFNLLRRKLNAFLPDYKVTVVYPVTHIKWLRWISDDSGEISLPRKSPKTGSAFAIFPELYRIKSFLDHPNLHFRIALLDIEEYRVLNGWSKDKKKGSTRNDGIPKKYEKEIKLDTTFDYLQFLPDDLPMQFTSKDYKKVSRLPQTAACTALNILNHLGVITRVGKQGNSFLYSKSEL